MIKKLQNGKVLISHDGIKVEAKLNGLRPSVKVTIRDKVASKMYHAILPVEEGVVPDQDYLVAVGERYLQRAITQRNPRAYSDDEVCGTPPISSIQSTSTAL